MPIDIDELKKEAWKYVESEAHTKVTNIELIEIFTLFGREDAVLSVTTTDSQTPEWWVIGGGTAMNLYSKKEYSDHDVAYSLHQGLTLRLLDKQNSDKPEGLH